MILPIVIRRDLDGYNGRNWPGFVILGRGIDRPAAVFAQEAWEARHKLNPVNLFRVRFIDRHRRRMEFLGHEIEVVVCALLYGQNEAAARRREAETMHRGYDGLFRAMAVDEIEGEMRERSPRARKWVRDNLNTIRRYE